MNQNIKYIKWVLMVFGAIGFKMFGAFAGFFIGIFIEEVLEGNNPAIGGDSERKNRFSNFRISDYQIKFLDLTAAVLRTNKLITKNQSYYILKYFYKQFGTENGKALFSILKEKVQQPVDYVWAAQSLKGKHREAKHQIIRFLYGLTKVDRPMHETERKVLAEIANNIGMSKYDFERIVRNTNYRKKTYNNSSTRTRSRSYLQNSYFILGVSETASEAELKKAYRKMVLKYHPDKTQLPKDVAAEKFQDVQEAYDAIRASKGIK